MVAGELNLGSVEGGIIWNAATCIIAIYKPSVNFLPPQSDLILSVSL